MLNGPLFNGTGWLGVSREYLQIN